MPKVKIEVFPEVAATFGGHGSGRLIMEEEVVEGETVREVFNRIAERYEGFGERVFDTRVQRLQAGVNLVFNDRLIELLQRLETQVKGGDTIVVIPAFSGG